MHASHSYVERYEMDLHNEEIQFRKKKRWEAIGAIKIHVHDIENKIHFSFMIKKTHKIRKMVSVYCDRYNNKEPACFELRGIQINENDTFVAIGIENGESIRVFV